MTSPALSLLKEFDQLTGTGNFATQGTRDFFLPRLFVQGVGEIAFPMIPAQIREIIGRAEAAPFGKGEETVYDPVVRKCHQLDSALFEFQSKEWEACLGKILSQIREELGIDGEISAHPYKLLIYGEGGHFKAHTDTEKLDAMFGTLLIALPSSHEGGCLKIRHAGKEVLVDFSNSSNLDKFQHAAFFADCEHEVVPVTSGYRCCVVYNLRLDQGRPETLNRPKEELARRLVAPLQKLVGKIPGEPLAILLDHGYTEANFSIANLKGKDRLRALAIFHAAEEAGLDAHLALIELHQSGTLEMEYHGRGRYRDWDDDYDSDPDSGEMGEICEEYLTLSQWRDGNDADPGFEPFSLDKECIISSEPFDDGEPDEREAEGYTGNAGCTMDYWYRGAAVVVWDKKEREVVLVKKSPASAAVSLLQMARVAGKREEFERFAHAMVRYLCDQAAKNSGSWLKNHFEQTLPATLSALARAKATNFLNQLTESLPVEGFSVCKKEVWVNLLSNFGTAFAVQIADRLRDLPPGQERRAVFEMLAAALEVCSGEPLATNLAIRCAKLVATPVENPGAMYVREANDFERFEIQTLVIASHLLNDQAGREQILAFCKGDASMARIREFLAPALLGLEKIPGEKNSLLPDVARFALDLLSAEAARPLPPYPDWKRPFPDLAKEKDRGWYPWPMLRNEATSGPIAELKKFMEDPSAFEHGFSRVQEERDQIQNFIRNYRLDLDCSTIKKGRPYTLRCTKNSKSHERALALREEDVKSLDRMREKFGVIAAR